MITDTSTLLSRMRGTLPDRYWNQLNGRSAVENYTEQKQAMTENDTEELIITSEVVVK